MNTKNFTSTLFILLLCLCSLTNTNAQVVSGNAFLQGNYVEVGISPCGTFGSTVAAPVGYHPRGGTAAPTNIGMVADPFQDGWATGSPNYIGDYFLPDDPEEGFGVQINGTNYNNNQNGSTNVTCGTNQISGSVTGYTNNGVEATATWTGSVAGLSITSVTKLQLNALYFTTLVTLTNTSGATLNNVYFMRTVNPDMEFTLSGENQTNNAVIYQNPNANNYALAQSTGVDFGSMSYLGIGSIDCRARVSYGGTTNRNPTQVYNGAGGSGIFTSGSQLSQNRCISIAFFLDDLAPGQSTTLAYAYITNSSQLTTALNSTAISFFSDGTQILSGSSAPTCSGQTFPLDIINTTGYNSWTWSPATGLNTTTGTSVVATISSSVTYTATGTGTCGTTALNVTLNPVTLPMPAAAGAITGSSLIVCPPQNNVTYSVPTIADATTYIWTIPPGAGILSGAGTNSIVVNYGPDAMSGNVTVAGDNVCGTGTPSSLFVNVVCNEITSAPATLCHNQVFSVPFTAIGTYDPGNIFTVQLSDAAGSFASPTAIGTLASTTSGSISCTTPQSVPFGGAYRIRIISSNPAISGPDNGSDIIINTFLMKLDVFNESMGNANATVTAHESGNGFDNDSYTMTADINTVVSNVSPSTGYTGASGGSNILMDNDIGDFFQIATIPTTGYQLLQLSFGISKSSTQSSGEQLVIEVSNDGITYSPLTFPALPTGAGTSNTWYYRTASGVIPATGDLRIRFRCIGTNRPNFRIDDVKLIRWDGSFNATAGGPTSFCSGGSVVLTASNAASYLWSNNETTQSITVTSTGNYTCALTGTNGCTAITTAIPVTFDAPPVITCPANISVTSAAGQCSATATFSATATGTPAPTISYSHASGSSFNVGTTTVTATASSSCGSSSCTFTVTVADDENPVITSGSIADCYQTAATAEAAAIAATTATDNCAGIITFSASTSGTCNAIVTVTATDINNNASNTMYSTRIDAISPVLTCPSVTSPIDCPASPVFGAATATDACDASVDITFTDATTPGSCPAEYTVTRTWTATDDCGNISTCSRSISVQDITAPVMNCPAVVSPINCTDSPVFPVATASDACDASVAIAFTDVTSPGCGNTYSVTRTWVASDDCGNTSSCSRTIVVQDITPPTIICPVVVSPIECPAAPAFGPALANDACDASVSIVFNDVTTAGCGNTYSVTRTWVASDDCGNTSSCSRTIVVQDITPPTINCPAVASPIACPASPVFPAASASDACDASVNLVFNDVTTAGCGNTYSVTRTWVASDDCGNTSSCSRTIMVQDITPPAIICPVVVSPIECPAAPVFGPALASDACDATVAIVFNDVTTAGCGNTYSVTRTWVASDDCGNTSSCSRTIVVQDITPPTINCPAVASPIACPASPVFPAASASDACDANVTIAFNDVTTAGCGNTYSVTRTWVASDDCGNTSSCSRTIMVQDITPPTINCPAVASPIACPASPVFPAATASDACDASVSIVFTDATTPGCGNTYSVTRTWVASDDCGNTSSCSRTISVQDITAPVMNCPAVVSPIACPAAPVFVAATATDACDASVSIAFTDVTTPGCGNTYSVTRTYISTDDCGNAATCSQTIVVQDITAPAITCPAPISVSNTAGLCGANVSFAASASDACSSPAFTYSIAPGSFFPVGTTTVTATATDGCGNSSSCSFTVTVNDVQAPNAICQNLTIQLNAAGTASITPAQVNNGSNDNCGTVNLVSVVPNTFSCANAGTILGNDLIISEYVEGSSNNKYIEIFNGTGSTKNLSNYELRLYSNGAAAPSNSDNLGVAGSLAPGATVVFKNNLAAAYIGTAFVLPAVNWNGDDAVALYNTVSAANADVFGRIGDDPGTAWTLGGNTTLDRTLRRKPAVASGVTTSPTGTGPGAFTTLSTQWDQFATDVVSGLGAHTFTPPAVSNTAVLTVSDAAGNTSTCSATITVQDITPPSAVCQNITVSLDATGNATVTGAQVNNGSSDACGIASLAVAPSGFTCANIGANTVTLTVTDVNGLTSTCSATVTIQDVTPPTANCQSVTVQLDGSGNASITAAQVNNGSSDNCTPVTLVSVVPSTFTCANISSPAADLIISEYVEGSSNNKYLEIYNGTSASVNLANYELRNYSNGAATPSFTNPLSGTLAAGATAVYKNSSAVLYGGPATVVSSIVFNGDDAMVLYKVSTASFVDILGRIGDDPGTAWTGGGGYSTENKTLRRKATVSAGVSVNPTGTGPSAFTTLTTEWDLFATDVVSGLGSHTYNGNNLVTLTVSDAYGNTSSCNTVVIVQDVTPPVITCPVSFSSCNPVSWTPPTATDNCSATLTSSHSPGVFPSGTTTVTYTATDPSGNTATCSFAITVLEPSAPALSITSDHLNNQFCTGDSVQLTLNGGSLGHSAQWNWYSGSCGGTLVASNTTSIYVAPAFAATYYVRAEGTCNTTNCVAITVINGSIFQTSVAAAVPNPICEDATSELNAIFTVRVNPALLITEVTQDGFSANGATSPRPSYFGASDDDFVEISNLSNSAVSLSGVSFELWSGSSLDRSYSFGAINLAGHSTLVLHIGTGLDSPSDNFYHTGGSSNPLAAGTPYGYILKSGSAVLDAAATNGYSWPGASGITVAQWTGSMVSNAGSAGSIRIGYIDNNNGGDWITADNSIRQSLGTYNGNYASNSQPAFNYVWTPATNLDNSFIQMPTVSGAAPGTYSYTVTATNPESGCSSSASTSLTVYALPTATISGDAEICVGDDATVTITFTGTPPFQYEFYEDALLHHYATNSTTVVRTVSPIGSGSASVVYTLGLIQDLHCESTGTGSAVITFDQVAPSFSGCPADFVACNPVSWIPPVAGDNCAVASVNSNYSPGDTFPAGTTTVTYVATDSNGNTAACSFNVTLSTVPPAFSGCPTSFSSCNPVTWTPPVATGTCAIASVASNYIPGATFPSGTTTVTYIATDSNGNTAACSFQVTLLEPSSVAGASLTSNREYNNICIGDNATLTLSGGTLGAGAVWKWYSGSCGGTPVATGVTSITVNPTVTTTYFVRAEGTCNNTACVSLQLIVSTGPPTATPVVLYAPTITYQGAVDSVILAPVPGATFYRWTSNGNAQLLFNGQPGPYQTSVPKVIITFINPSTQGNGIGNYHVQFVAGNACGRSTVAGSVRIRATVAQPTSLTGPLVACPGQTKTYTVSPVIGAKTYQWSLIPASAGTIVGNGTQTVNVTFAAGFTSAQLCVHGVAAFNSSGPDICITISKIPGTPGAISGNLTPCPGTSAVYRITPVTGAISYNWTVTGGATIQGPSTLDSVVVLFPNSSFSSNVCVSANSGCGNSTSACTTVVNGVAPPMGTITGPESGLCGLSGINYQVPSSGALSYVWAVPAGATIDNGQGTNAILVSFSNSFTGGIISILASNSCGSTPGSLAVIGAPATPVISGATASCATFVDNYTATAQGATGYDWFVHPDSGNIIPTANPNEILVEWITDGGSVSVVASNDCGESDTATLLVGPGCPPRLGTGMHADRFSAAVFPNPNQGQFSLEFQGVEESAYSLRVSDLAGRRLVNRDLQGVPGLNRIEMDLSNLAKGVYMISLENAAGDSAMIRVVIE